MKRMFLSPYLLVGRVPQIDTQMGSDPNFDMVGMRKGVRPL